jgi:hypothetical protein
VGGGLRRGLRVTFLVEEGLEDEGGGDLVDEGFVLLTGMSGLVEDLVGFAGGEALVPEMDGQAGERAEFGGKGLGFGGAWALVAGEEVQGVADDDADDGEPAGETRDGTEVFARVAAGFEGQDGLGGEAEFVRDGDADAFGTDVEGEIARRRVHSS